MVVPKKQNGMAAEERRQAVAELLAKGILRLGTDLPVLQSLQTSETALQSPPKQGSMSTVVDAPIPGESRHGAKRREGSRSDAPNDGG